MLGRKDYPSWQCALCVMYIMEFEGDDMREKLAII
jgi:hypothetical protein